MWIKYLFITLLFYFFAILQNSFLPHFNIFGITPNFILIFYFLLIFFEKTDKFYLGTFGAVVAGFFLDILSHSFFGISIVLLLAMMVLIKKALQLLWNRAGEYSVFYFLPLFIAYIMFYYIFLADFNVSWILIVAVTYNLAFALFGFYICKKFNIFKNSNKWDLEINTK